MKDYFDFKHFRVYHDRCANKVGTDGVLLGAWCDVADDKRLLDVGTGSGIIALMLAQRNEKASITGIEYNKDAAEQAKENVNSSPYSARIEIVNADFNEWCTEQTFDHIVSNPPYFEEDVLSSDEARSSARHTTSLTFADLIKKSKALLTDNGKISLVLPHQQLNRIKGICALERMHLLRQTDIITTEGKLPKRCLLTFSKQRGEDLKHDTLQLQEKDGQRTATYTELTKDFYLW